MCSGNTRVYKGTQGCTKGIQVYTRVYKGIQGFTGGIQGVYRGGGGGGALHELKVVRTSSCISGFMVTRDVLKVLKVHGVYGVFPGQYK